MLSTEERRTRLEELLERVARNRSKLGPGTDASAPAASAPEPTAPPAPAPTVAASPSLELDEDVAEIEVDEAPVSIDLGDEDGGMVLDLTPEDEVGHRPATGGETIVDASSPLAKPATKPIPADAAPDQTLVDADDEPEIEVSYGTEEALALQAELGLAGDDIPDELMGDNEQMTLVDVQMSQELGEPMGDLDYDDLPAPGVPAAKAGPTPTEPYPSPKEAAPKPTKPLPAESAPTATPRSSMQAKTVEDLSEPMLELTKDQEVVESADKKTPVPTSAEEPKTPPAADSSDALAAALSFEPTPTPEPQPDAEVTPQTYSAPAPEADGAQVVEVVGAPPAQRASTLGNLLKAALDVGRKK